MVSENSGSILATDKTYTTYLMYVFHQNITKHRQMILRVRKQIVHQVKKKCENAENDQMIYISTALRIS